jgi:hypothetical protein
MTDDTAKARKDEDAIYGRIKNLENMVRRLISARDEAEDVRTGNSALADIVFQLNSLEDVVNALVSRLNKA